MEDDGPNNPRSEFEYLVESFLRLIIGDEELHKRWVAFEKEYNGQIQVNAQFVVLIEPAENETSEIVFPEEPQASIESILASKHNGHNRIRISSPNNRERTTRIDRTPRCRH